nr:hypothetical protein Iba_chr14dCG1010 [Ipomoea batatas]
MSKVLTLGLGLVLGCFLQTAFMDMDCYRLETIAMDCCHPIHLNYMADYLHPLP